MARPTENPFLVGNFAPVADETTITGLVVDGTIPASLAGAYLRIGPNPIGNAPEPYDWALGDGMVHAVTLQPGSAASYRNRWVKTAAASTRLGTEPVPGPRPDGVDRSNANVIAFGRRLLALGDGALPYELTTGLDTIRRVDLTGEARGIGARPRTDPVTGELHVLSSTDRSQQRHEVIAAPGRPTTGRALSPPDARRVHDLVVTRRHVAFVAPGVVGLTDRAGAGLVHWVETGSDRRVVPIVAHDDGEAVGLHVTGPSLERWTVDPTTGDARHVVIDAAPQALGRANPDVVGGLRYLYTVAAGGPTAFGGTEIYKHDLVGQTRQTCDFGPGRHPGEFLFVADRERHDREDGGWLLGFVHDDASGRDALVVLDAEDLHRPAVSTVHLPRRVPYGRHGTWVPMT